MKEMKCPKCEYTWTPRVKEPKACPRCKSRLDAPRAGRHPIAWKYADPTEDARWVYDQSDYDEIYRQDPGLLKRIGKKGE